MPISQGPWESRTFDEYQTVILSKNELVAIISVGEGRPHGEANVNAIRAVPDLLNLLKRYRDPATVDAGPIDDLDAETDALLRTLGVL